MSCSVWNSFTNTHDAGQGLSTKTYYDKMVNGPSVGSQEGRDQTGCQMKQKMTEIPALFSFPGDREQGGEGAWFVTRCFGQRAECQVD